MNKWLFCYNLTFKQFSIKKKHFHNIMKTSKDITTRKMSVYWPTLLLLNGINVYPGHKNRGKYCSIRFVLIHTNK